MEFYNEKNTYTKFCGIEESEENYEDLISFEAELNDYINKNGSINLDDLYLSIE